MRNHPPTNTLVVGPWEYRLVPISAETSEDIGKWADVDHATQTIRYCNEAAAPLVAESLWHEAKHIAWHRTGLGDDRHGEEAVIVATSPWEWLILTSNPWLIDTASWNQGEP